MERETYDSDECEAVSSVGFFGEVVRGLEGPESTSIGVVVDSVVMGNIKLTVVENESGPDYWVGLGWRAGYCY